MADQSGKSLYYTRVASVWEIPVLHQGCFSLGNPCITPGLLQSGKSLYYTRVASVWEIPVLHQGCFSLGNPSITSGLSSTQL